MLATLNLSKKFLILAAIALLLVAMPTVLFINSTSALVDTKHLERSGIAIERATLRALHAVQQRREADFASGRSGSDASGEIRAATDRADEAFAEVGAQIKADIDSKDPAVAAWQKAQQLWTDLKPAAATQDHAQQASAAYGALIQQLLTANGVFLDHYQLSLDADLDSYQLISGALVDLPALTNELSKTELATALPAAEGQPDAARRVALADLLERIGERGGAAHDDFAKAIAANPQIGASIGKPIDDAQALVDQAVNATRAGLVDLSHQAPAMPSGKPPFAQAVESAYKADATAIDFLDTLLGQQGDSLRREQILLLGMIAGVLLVAGLFAVAVVRSVTRPIASAVAFAQRVSEGDLTSTVEVPGGNETGRLLGALNTMNQSLGGIVADVRSGAGSIADAVEELAVGNTDLSQRTEEQAASLQQTASSMEQLTAAVRQNTDNARQATELAHAAAQASRGGGEAVESVVGIMSGISDSSLRMREIIGVIEGIAFQTNILALNAAVEAARAGDQGRGFAVVAGEVRALAQRSAVAAKDIKGLIETSVSRIVDGTAVVQGAGLAVTHTVSVIGQLATVMSEISAASVEQSAGIDQVNVAIAQMDQITQQNAALVEEAAAAATSLAGQAHALRAGVSVFHLESH
nr:methyl-accepting chemotaxis protein [Paraburkholderia bryophila]